MQRYDRSQVILFLHSLDALLRSDLEIFVIGGLAAILGYDADVKTVDMDVFTIHAGSEADLKQAAEAARKVTGVALLLDRASIAELPYNYEDRKKSLRGVSFKKLTVTVPDKYDLVLSKALRAYEHDLDAIQSIHAHHPLSEKTLAQRFETEIWKEATTDPRKFALHMVMVMRLLYGEDRAKYYMTKWERDLTKRKWK
jgi:Nucleotidyltransferase of unknown function (DUF6036)